MNEEATVLSKSETISANVFLEWLKEEARREGFTAPLQDEIEMPSATRGRIYLERGRDIWGAAVNINISFSRQSKYPNVEALECSVDISWSSTGRSLANAIAAVENYQAAIRLVARIEAYAAGRYILPAQPQPQEKDLSI